MIAEIEAREREKTGIKNLRIKYNRVFGYSIEVTNSFKDKVPYEYRRRQTLANAERYVTDELKQAEDRILSSSEKSLRLEIELFEKIKEVLASQLGALKRLAGAIAMLDCLAAFASLAKESGYCRPQIAEEGGALRIAEGRHPVVEALSQRAVRAERHRFGCGDAHDGHYGPQYGGQEHVYAPDGADRPDGARRLLRSGKVGADPHDRPHLYPRRSER